MPPSGLSPCVEILYAKACDDSQVDKADTSAVQSHRLNAVGVLRANKPTLEEPVQVKLHEGDAVFMNNSRSQLLPATTPYRLHRVKFYIELFHQEQ